MCFQKSSEKGPSSPAMLVDVEAPTKNFNALRILAFPDEYSIATLFRPDVAQAERVQVRKRQRLTPSSYDRNIFHLELDLTGTQKLKDYKMGDALAVYPKNSYASVNAFIRAAFLADDESSLESIRQASVVLPSSLLDASTEVVSSSGLFSSALSAGEETDHQICITTIERLLTTILDINGSPTKEFFKQLSSHAIDILEKVRLAELTLERMQEEFDEIVVQAAATYSTVLKAFPSARPPIQSLIEMIPPMKPRLYSIASSSLYQPGQLDLLVVEETWKPKGTMKSLNPLLEHRSEAFTDEHSGLCSHYLSELKPGDTVTASLTLSTMLLPRSQSTPVVMAGLGTGMAPFRAFLQEKLYWKRRGLAVGPLALYFGSRHKNMEFLYGDELEWLQTEGILTRLACAFSRDQPQKIYIQDRIREDSELLAKLLVTSGGHFYLCGPTWPAEDVKEALISAFINYGDLQTREQAEELLKQMKEDSRYVLEVY